MRTRRLLRHGLRGMGRHRLRTFFMMLGTFVGVLALTIVVAIGQGTRDSMIASTRDISCMRDCLPFPVEEKKKRGLYGPLVFSA